MQNHSLMAVVLWLLLFLSKDIIFSCLGSKEVSTTSQFSCSFQKCFRIFIVLQKYLLLLEISSLLLLLSSIFTQEASAENLVYSQIEYSKIEKKRRSSSFALFHLVISDQIFQIFSPPPPQNSVVVTDDAAVVVTFPRLG